MKYLLFAGTEYYAKGGALDFQKTSESIEELVSFFYENEEQKYWDWYQITDQDLKIVRQSHKQAHSY
jgi:hypothetical protein